jgi:hypothetical protein
VHAKHNKQIKKDARSAPIDWPLNPQGQLVAVSPDGKKNNL